MEIVVMGEQHTLTAFRLAGLCRVYEAECGRDKLRELLKDDSVGVLILTERFADEHRKIISEYQASKHRAPIIVEVPDVKGPVEQSVDPVHELVRRAIGANIK
jgi:V/A-type H+-transporting ATPase subunit F